MGEEQISIGDHGKYEELAARPNPEGLHLSFAPSLKSVLERGRDIKGEELAPEEVRFVLHNALVVVVDDEALVTADRGYEDLDPVEVLRALED